MKLTSDNETLAENKILILYILDLVKRPLSNDEFYKLVLSTTDMNYFYFQQFLLDLTEDKYIETYAIENLPLYRITTIGKNALNLTKDILPGIVKLKVDSNFKTQLDAIEEETSISADFTPKSETEFMVTCKLTENNQSTFEIKTFAGSIEIAKTICSNWNENANKIYPKIIDILTKEQKED